MAPTTSNKQLDGAIRLMAQTVRNKESAIEVRFKALEERIKQLEHRLNS